MNVRKQLAFFCATLLFLQSITLSLPYAYTETEDSVDPQQVEAFRSHQPEYLQLNQPMLPSEQKTDAIQTFSFMDKTFRTTAGQPVLVRFTCALPADEVLIRIPIEGQVVEEQFSNGESIQHSHGEYWVLKTSSHQTDFVLPVVFGTAGQYFLTIDHDADHFYLEIEEGISSTDPDTQEKTGLSEQEEAYLKDQRREAQNEETMNKIPCLTHPVAVTEKNLPISEELIAIEDARILEEITDPQNRNTSSATNWSQFRSAWNSSRTSTIYLQDNIFFSSSILGDSLSTRSNSVTIDGIWYHLSFGGSNNSLSMQGGNLTIKDCDIFGGQNSTTPLVSHSRIGTIILTGSSLRSSRNAPVVSLSGQSVFRLEGDSVVNLDSSNSARSPIRLADSSSLTMTGGRIGSGGINRPIESTANTNIYIRGNNVMMAENLAFNGSLLPSAFRITWYSIDVHLTGTNGSIVVSSTSNPNDFEERYLLNHGNSSYRSLLVGVTGSAWVDPPIPSYNLIVKSNPSEGGSTSSELTTIEQNKNTLIHANPNEGYSFVSWEILSGNGASIADETAETTTFTMGSSDVVLQANYEEETVVIRPMDPLNPENEVNPENPPDLPVDQGLLSIDFISSFNFGSQVISAQDQTYFAQPQRLLNEDGTVNQLEERPNYVQISDRRPENERNGWQLAVTQKEQFKGKENQKLLGASLSLSNQQVITAQGSTAPGLQSVPFTLIPGNRRTLLKAQGNEGTGTWIYRFGDADTQGESVALNVPKGSTPEATTYSTTLIWELSAVPN